MTRQTIPGGYADNLINTGGVAEYNWVSGGYLWGTTERFQVIPTAGKLTNFMVYLSAAAGSGAYILTIRKGAWGGGSMADTTLSITLTDPASTGTDTDEVTCAAGDRISISSSYTGTPTATPTARWSVDFKPDDESETIVLGGSSDGPTVPATEWNLPSACGTLTWGATEITRQQVCPLAGTIKKLYVRLGTAPGGSYVSTFKIRLGGGDSGVVATITGSATEGSDTSNTSAVAAGNILGMQVTTVTGAAMATVAWGFVIDATTVGEFPIMTRNTTTIVAATYGAVCSWTDSWSTESSIRREAGAFTVKAVYGEISAVPGGATARSFQLRDDTADVSGAVLAFGAADSTKNVTGLSVAVVAGSMLGWYHSVTDTPAAATCSLAICGYNAPEPSTQKKGSVVPIMMGLIEAGVIV